jgi:hypothetical protein
LHPYVEEDQEEEGQDAPLEGESRQAPQHGPLTHEIDETTTSNTS